MRCSSMVALEDNLSRTAGHGVDCIMFLYISSIHDGSATFCLFTTSYFRFGD